MEITNEDLKLMPKECQVCKAVYGCIPARKLLREAKIMNARQKLLLLPCHGAQPKNAQSE